MSTVTPPSSMARRARRRRVEHGFTLVELTVALVAGLIVALAIAGLSREATNSFHEEVRVSAAEAGLRTAVDRLRADVQRAAYMSTPNIQLDPMIAHAPGQPNIPATVTDMRQILAGIRLYAGSSAQSSSNGIGLSTTNNLAPAIVDITGNLTTAEQFEVQAIKPNDVGTCTRLLISVNSPGFLRMLNANDAGAGDPNIDAEMRNIFQPVPAANTNQFVVRLVDDTGRSQFLLTCATAQAAGVTPNVTPVQGYVLVATAPITSAQTGGIGGVAGNAAGRAWINPVQTVRWEVVGPGSPDAVPTQDVNALDGLSTAPGTRDPNKYDLMRSYVDMGAAIPGNTTPPSIIPATSEIIAEYAVDLDFAFAVETGDPGSATGSVGPKILTYDFGDANNQKVADIVTKVAPPPAGPANPDPQRVRSVRMRIATRAAMPDRSVNIPVSALGATPALYLYRYNVPVTGNPLKWARVRTLVTEVSLPNQSRAYY